MTKELNKYNYCQEAIQKKSEIENNFLLLGSMLYKINEEKMFDSSWDSFEDFCIELKMSMSNVWKLIQIYRTFVLEYGLSEKQLTTAGGISLLADILPAIKNKKDAEKWIAKASILTRSDLRKELAELKSGIPMKDCKHKDTFIIKVCRDCGNKERIYEE